MITGGWFWARSVPDIVDGNGRPTERGDWSNQKV